MIFPFSKVVHHKCRDALHGLYVCDSQLLPIQRHIMESSTNIRSTVLDLRFFSLKINAPMAKDTSTLPRLTIDTTENMASGSVRA